MFALLVATLLPRQPRCPANGFLFSAPFSLAPSSLFSLRLNFQSCSFVETVRMYFMTHTYLQAHTLFSTITLLFSLRFVCFLALLLLPWLTIEEWFNQGECPPSTLLTSASSSPPSFLLLILTAVDYGER